MVAYLHSIKLWKGILRNTALQGQLAKAVSGCPRACWCVQAICNHSIMRLVHKTKSKTKTSDTDSIKLLRRMGRSHTRQQTNHMVMQHQFTGDNLHSHSRRDTQRIPSPRDNTCRQFQHFLANNIWYGPACCCTGICQTCRCQTHLCPSCSTHSRNMVHLWGSM